MPTGWQLTFAGSVLVYIAFGACGVVLLLALAWTLDRCEELKKQRHAERMKERQRHNE